MDFIIFLANNSFINITLTLLSIYLLFSLCYGVSLSANQLSYPNLLKFFNYTNTFVLITIIYFFNFDFFYYDFTHFYNQMYQLVFLLTAVVVLFSSIDFLKTVVINKYEYELLVIFTLFSSISLCFADDFLIIYLALEIQSLSFYVFATFNRISEFNTESGLKYFIFGSIISCLLLFGFVLIYVNLGITTFELLFTIVLSTSDYFIISGVTFIMIAFLFKTGAAPFHIWLCDVYEGAILSVTLLFSSLPKIILFGLIVKLFHFVFYDIFIAFSNFFLFSSLTSIGIGSIAAIYQKRIKRLLGYSTINHTGFILLAITMPSAEATKILSFYIVIYTIITLLLFALLIYCSISTKKSLKYLTNWSSFYIKNSIFTIAFAFALFSVAGIPPLAGFFSKFFVLLSVISHKYYLTAILIITLSSIGCFYYIRLIKIFYFIGDRKNADWISNINKFNTELVISSFLMFNICFFFKPTLLLNFTTIIGLILF